MALETVGGGGSEGSKSSEFPAGMRILLVDDCVVSLAVIKRMLTACNYKVTPCQRAKVALTLLREQKGEFDLVITDVHMPEMDGFQLLKAIYSEMDIPVILLSSDLRTEMITKAIKNGACDYISKPSSVEQYKNIWQHVYRKQLASRNNKEEADSEVTSSKKKTRVKWTPDLHQKFTLVIGQLGLDKATPLGIMERMNDPNLTKEHIASHLQKFRKCIRKNGHQMSRISQQMIRRGGLNAAQNNPMIQQNPQFQVQESFKASNLQPNIQSRNFKEAFQPQELANTQFSLDQPQSSNFQLAFQPQNAANTQFLLDQAWSSNFQVANQPQEPANIQSQSSNFQVVIQPQELVNTQFLPDQPQNGNFHVPFQPQKVAYTQLLSDQAQGSNFQVAFQDQEPANAQPQSSNFQVGLQPQALENAQFLRDQPQSSNLRVAFQSQEVPAFQHQELASNFQPVHNYPMGHNASPMSLAQNNPIPVPQNPNNMGQMQMQEQGFTNVDMMQNYSVYGANISPSGGLPMVHNENNNVQENGGNQYFVGEGSCANNAANRIVPEEMGTKALLFSILNSSSEDEVPDFDRYNKVWN